MFVLQDLIIHSDCIEAVISPEGHHIVLRLSLSPISHFWLLPFLTGSLTHTRSDECGSLPKMGLEMKQNKYFGKECVTRACSISPVKASETCVYALPHASLKVYIIVTCAMLSMSHCEMCSGLFLIHSVCQCLSPFLSAYTNASVVSPMHFSSCSASWMARYN